MNKYLPQFHKKQIEKVPTNQEAKNNPSTIDAV